MTALVVSRGNRALNPRAVSSGANLWSSAVGYGTTGAGAISYVTGTVGPVGDVTTCRRKTWSTASTGGTGVGFMLRGDGSNYTAVTAGEQVTVSVYVRHSVTDRTYALRCRFFNGLATSSTQVGADAWGSNFTVPAGTGWTRLSNTFVVPAGALSVQINPETVTAETWPIGATQDATGLLVESGPVLNDYFDGSSTDTATAQFEWAAAPNNSVSRQVDTISPWSGPSTRNPLLYWDGAWVPVDTVGLTGPTGPAGPEGIRPSCGGCSHIGGQSAQPNSVMWDVSAFVADPTYAADTDPCLQVFDTSTLQTRRAGTFVITASAMLNGKGTTAGSSMTIAVSQSGGAYVDFCRGPINKGSDRAIATSIATLGSGDKLKFRLWIVVGAPPTKVDVVVMAAVLP